MMPTPLPNPKAEDFARQAARVLREDGKAMASQLILGWGEVHGLKGWEVRAIADRSLHLSKLPPEPPAPCAHRFHPFVYT